MKIYLVDDDEISNFLFKSKFIDLTAKNEVCTFTSPNAALVALNAQGKSGYPNLLFLDLSMPGMDGWEFLDELAKEHPDLLLYCKIYIRTSSIREEDEARAKNHPMITRLLQKPISQEDIEAILSLANNTTGK